MEVVQLSKQRVVDDLDPNVVPAMTHIPHYFIRAMARNEQQPIEPLFRQGVDASVEHARSIDAQQTLWPAAQPRGGACGQHDWDEVTHGLVLRVGRSPS